MDRPITEQEDLTQSLDLIDRSMEQVVAGEGRSLKKAIREIAVGLSHGPQGPGPSQRAQSE